MSKLERLKQLKSKISKGFTVERLRSFEGFEEVSEEAAKNIIASLSKYCSIVLRQINRLKSNAV